MSEHTGGNSSGEQAGEAPVSLPPHVLVVENHSDTRQGVNAFLQTLGWRAAFAENKAQALALAEGQTFDVLLSDISLPDGTGWELLETLDAQGHRPAHAIAMSGLSDAADHSRSREAGYEIHLVKPFSPKDLENVLRGLTDFRVHRDTAERPKVSASSEALRKRLHDGLCQHLAAAALLQGALANQLEKVAADPAGSVPRIEQAVEECRQISRILDEALQETLSLLRSL